MDEQERDLRINVSRSARSAVDKNDPMGWFEPLYKNAENDISKVPWADSEPNPFFVEWLKQNPLDGTGKKALIVGCGLGDDAELVAQLGFDVTAFDIAPTAIEWAKRRWPETAVTYLVADLFSPPPTWLYGFDFVLEIYTIQALPLGIRPIAMSSVANLVGENGTLLFICAGRDDDITEPKGPPWPISRQELAELEASELERTSFEDLGADNHLPVSRFRAVYQRGQLISFDD